MKKILYVVLDGVGDDGHPVRMLGGKTPLQAARTPHLDALTAWGRLGLLGVVEGGIAPQSDQGVFALLGYPAEAYPGRGLVEALGAGLSVPEGGIALRTNFATAGKEADGTLWILDRRAGRNTTSGEARQLAREVNEAVDLTGVHPRATFTLVTTEEHRGVLILHVPGVPLSPLITNTDPGYARRGLISPAVREGEFVCQVEASQPLRPEELERLVGEGRLAQELEAARLASRLLNEFTRQSHRVLGRSPVNRRRVDRTEANLRALGLSPALIAGLFASTKDEYDARLAEIKKIRQGKRAGQPLEELVFPPADLILARDAGARLAGLPTLFEKDGVRFAAVVQMPVEVGMAKITGMDLIQLPPTPSRPSWLVLQENYHEFVRAVRENLARYDGLYLHIKGPDLPAHDGDAAEKKRVIEAIDEFFFGPLREFLDLDRTVLAVTADHSTPAALRSHTGDPVPVLVATGGLEPDRSRRFTEQAAARQVAQGRGLGFLRGADLLQKLVGLARQGNRS